MTQHGDVSASMALDDDSHSSTSLQIIFFFFFFSKIFYHTSLEIGAFILQQIESGWLFYHFTNHSGKITYYTAPPESSSDSSHHVHAEIVTAWSKEFNIDELVAAESEMISGKPCAFSVEP